MKPPPSFIRVLLIEPNQSDERLIVENLRVSGAGQFIICGNFRNLEEAAQKTWGPQGADVVLAGMAPSEGKEAFTRLAEAMPDLPLVILCSPEGEAAAAEMVQSGAQDYLVKTELSGKLLVRSLRYAVEHRRAERAVRVLADEMKARLEERNILLSKTKQRLAEVTDELDQLRGEAANAERFLALDRIAAGLSHDLNNALSPILAHSEWLLRKPELINDTSSVRGALCSIHESAERCAEMVLRLRDICRDDCAPAAMEPLDLREVLNEAILTTRPSWKDHAQLRGCDITVKTELEAVPKVKGAREDLVEMFSDLILNAVDAIRAEGTISISVSSPDEEHVDVCVADNGAGPVNGADDSQNTCPSPFRNGLGLGMVYGIAQRHGAEVVLSGWSEGGTNISIQFPVVKEETPKLEAASVGALSSLRILAVEDEPNIREILGIYLSENGHKVEVAADGDEALAKFKRNRFDLLLTDYAMPNMNGDRLAAAVRAADPKIRVALLTGFGSQLPQGAPLRLEVDTIIPKPFTFESLEQGIAEAMRQ